MEVTAEKNEKIGRWNFGSIYKMYIQKVEAKDRTKDELNQVIQWLTSYSEDQINAMISDENVDLKAFFKDATINENAHLIKGKICGYRIEDIDDKYELYRQCRYLDKLVDELAKGKKMEKILREG